MIKIFKTSYFHLSGPKTGDFWPCFHVWSFANPHSRQHSEYWLCQDMGEHQIPTSALLPAQKLHDTTQSNKLHLWRLPGNVSGDAPNIRLKDFSCP